MLAALVRVSEAVIAPDAVAILYNSALPESKKLAEIYRDARSIPEANLIGLEMPTTADITRADYDRSIAKPLRKQFDERGWWQRAGDGKGVSGPVMNKIQVLVTMRGVPLRIQPVPKAAGAAANPQNPIAGRDEASVDSELAMVGVEGLPIDGVLQNRFYSATTSFPEAKLPFLILTARIDAPTFATCERMIRDAVEAENAGLWGRAYVDIANKFPQGDQWLEAVVKGNRDAGIPTVVDRYNDTLPKNYPMLDASMYFGWYDWNLSGPFLNPRFRFRKGAVAIHLHSFSSEQLSDGSKNWCGGLLEKGAAVTVGNVYEPYLHLTHDFEILHNRLLAGYSWVEACWMAMPATSWQGVVLGDPLYRPFLHMDGTGKMNPDDIEFRALRAAAVEWKNNPLERQKQVEKASDRMNSGVLAEAAGLELIERGESPEAVRWFRAAKGHYVKMEDKLRQDINLVGIDRAANRKDVAILGLRECLIRYSSLPEAEALKGWLEVLNPAPPAPK